MSFKHSFRKFLFGLKSRKMLSELKEQSKSCIKAQSNKLLDILAYGKDTAYAKEYQFEKIKNIKDFQKYVPVNTYEDFKPYIQRQAKGEENVIVPERPLLYALTRGTTSEPKQIPITQKYYKECYSTLHKLWLYTLLKQHPEILDGCDLTLVNRAIEGYTEDKTPVGAICGYFYNKNSLRFKKFHYIPTFIYRIHDYFSRFYTVARISLQEDITLIATANPSFLVELNSIIVEFKEDLINDIEKGTLKSNLDIPQDILTKIKPLLKPNPKRAEELRRLAREYTLLYPKHYWPNLSVIVTWKWGSSGLYLEHLKGIYPDKTVIREYGYIATEIRAGIVLEDDQHPSILACHLAFFEFIKIDEMKKHNPRIYLASEVEEGEYYYLIATTSSGLYRYNINDIVRVDGFYNQFPMVTFIERGDSETILSDERFHEAQLIEAVKTAEEQEKMPAEFYLACADIKASCYHLYMEFKESYSDEKVRNFCFNVDNALRKINEESGKKKKGPGRLKSLKLYTLMHLPQPDKTLQPKAKQDRMFRLFIL
jgi:hypothetical protein